MPTKTLTTLSVIFVLLFHFSFLNANPEYDNSRINFMHSKSLKDIQKQAWKQNKPIFIDFHASWCAPCKRMDKLVFENPRVAEYMNKNFINYKVDISKNNGPTLALLYGVEFLPTVVIIKPNGKLILKKSTIMGSNKFLEWAQTGIKYYNYSKPENTKKIIKYTPNNKNRFKNYYQSKNYGVARRD